MKKLVTAIVVVLLLICGVVWALRGGEDPQVAKVKQLTQEMETATPEQRRERRQEMRDEMEKLTPEQREALRDEMRSRFERQMNERIAEYFKLSAAEKTAYLDKQIKEMEDRRKEWEARRQQRDASGGANSGGSGGQAGAGGPGGPGGPGGSNAQGGSNPGRNLNGRADRGKKRLDRTTAEQRAQRSQYLEDMNSRRLALGLPVMRPGRGGGGFGGPGR